MRMAGKPSVVKKASKLTVVIVICLTIIATGFYSRYTTYLTKKASGKRRFVSKYFSTGPVERDANSEPPNVTDTRNVQTGHIATVTGHAQSTTDISVTVPRDVQALIDSKHAGTTTPSVANTCSGLSDEMLKTKERLDARMERVVRLCRDPNIAKIRKRTNEVRKVAFDRLSYCPIPKCGTTFIRRDLGPTMKAINGNATFPDEKRKTFFLVREPFSRLVSAFFSKIVGLPYWWGLSGKIVKEFRTNATDRSIRCGYDTTFPEYIKFVIDLHKGHWIKDPHFTRIMEVCNICKEIPDFVATLETIKDDMKYILNTVDVQAMTNKSFVEVDRLAKNFLKYHRQRNLTDCGSKCISLERYWYGQQATGLISDDIELPVKGEECERITGDKMAELAWAAYLKSLGRINKREKKKQVVADLYQQVPVEDREEIARLLSVECEIFGYDPRPAHIFPQG